MNQEDWEEDELWEAMEDDAEDEIECSECGASVYAQAVACPHCGYYLTDEATGWTRPNWWLALVRGAAVLLLLAFLLPMLRGLYLLLTRAP